MEFEIIPTCNKYGVGGYDVAIRFVGVIRRARFHWWWKYKKDAKRFIKNILKKDQALKG